MPLQDTFAYVSVSANPNGASWLRRCLLGLAQVTLGLLLVTLVRAAVIHDPLLALRGVDVPLGTALVGPLDVVLQLSGTSQCGTSVEVKAHTSDVAYPIRRCVADGAEVRRGETLARYDAAALLELADEREIAWRKLMAEEAQARAELAATQNRLEGETSAARLQVHLAKLDREKYLEGDLKMELADRRFALATAEREAGDLAERLEHLKNFVRKGFASAEQLKAKKAELDQARHRLARERGQLWILETYARHRQELELSMRVARCERELKRAEQQAAKELEAGRQAVTTLQARIEIERRRCETLRRLAQQPDIVAPCAGIVLFGMAESLATEHETISLPAGKPICRIVDPNHAVVTARCTSAEAARIRPGHAVLARVQHDLHRRHGRVRAIRPANAADRAGEFDVELDVERRAGQTFLRPDQHVAVQVYVEHRSLSLIVPRTAIARHDGDHVAFVLGQFGLQRRVVSVGESGVDSVEIKAGLEPGEQVALDATARLFDLVD